ncbi:MULTISPECIES: FAD-dependent oxidoreductase [Mesorhizobium]|uniref:FAD-dependent oxidoreductase n=1 Tax=Mesorhizobium TaxID=68287 RepID=UPI0007ECD4E5|nr:MULTISPECIES: FAD-dependent oxidoreductase [unclassified Mesorhizobium]ARP67268.1 hypothetical protein A9K65_031005 [Mesorhizobium sp. WSM1497]MCA0004178.1 FAD-dependent oxidoreductase [Mesorhizobium sp. B264B2A]MCA0010401.1 FAD-dependent oxidoreductase [Mesorhizobium sp. B264B1B]MCA0035618.1 FAD-dependent oxidoreductase [Mesorhizobium sp. B263B2A]MCA0041827.1 FAD-dependent oxidoreductase [Mesorhizobium sp. B292B1B]MCA0060399.1 FAD-dependent oxidoreductase [Mesorhizobium sp. B261B1A]
MGIPLPKPLHSAHRPRDYGLFLQFKTVPLKASWAGMIDAMPDVVPIVDRAAAILGLVIATGMSSHGFGIGPGMGGLVGRPGPRK